MQKLEEFFIQILTIELNFVNLLKYAEMISMTILSFCM